MGHLNKFWSLAGVLLAATYLHAPITAANSSVNVALKAAFPSPPYLLELLETAGDENATSYFPLLDRIADGYFAEATTDQQLYTKFVELLQNEGHMDAQTLARYKLSLSLHSATPRVEAHYQFYHTAIEPSLTGEIQASCPNWVSLNNKIYCSPTLAEADGNIRYDLEREILQFDRFIGNASAPASILYADLSSPTFGQFHKTLIQTAREGKTSYRIRHRRPLVGDPQPLIVSGYGVELALKRTDYIVIDDRDSDKSPSGSTAGQSEVKLEDEDIEDLKPLSSSELLSLGLKTASFILQSEDPFQTLIKISQDFPKYSTALSGHNASESFLTEHLYNRGIMGPAGYNVLWLNGLQVAERQIDALTLLGLLRREKALIDGALRLGLTGPEAVSLLAHKEIAYVQAVDEPVRYDWTDELEGGNAIVWLNDIEKDKRYADWSDKVEALLQRVYPGQLPGIRRDIFNLVLPVDLSSPEDVRLVVGQLQTFVKRKIPIRFGFIPLTQTKESRDQAKVVYELLDVYGISAVVTYLDSWSFSKRLITPDKNEFEAIANKRKPKQDKIVRPLEEVVTADDLNQRVTASQRWVSRLAADGKVPTFFVNGVAIPRTETWLQGMSGRVNMDLQSIQRAVFDGIVTDDEAWIPNHFLKGASPRRNPFIIPEDPDDVKFINIHSLYEDQSAAFELLPTVKASSSAAAENWVHLIVVVDLSTVAGQEYLTTALELREANPGIEIVVVQTSESVYDIHKIFALLKDKSFKSLDTAEALRELLQALSASNSEENVAAQPLEEAKNFWTVLRELIKYIGLAPGQQGLLINGRLLGPIPSNQPLVYDDLVELLAYERKMRVAPVYKALNSLALDAKVSSPLAGAKIISLVALSGISELPEGMFEQESTLRIDSFESWQSKHTAIEIGDANTAGIRIIALIDPASEQAQRWIPILKVLSELNGVYLRLYLNPKERLEELPVKRFYRYLLNASPEFDEDGNLKDTSAKFSSVPKEALLTVGLDVPPAWLVAPKKSVHDLDNIKLSNIKGDVDALYEIEHILIEGHSRESSRGEAPRGAQLVLSTPSDPHVADTMIMANLGYFQFKTNPGLYKIDLKKGRSSDVFKIDSLGSAGYKATPGDDSPQVALMSFQGTTLYPRLSRNPGYEKEDVLDYSNTTADLVNRGLRFAEGIIGWGKAKVGIVQEQEQAEINIFSVASGHLYERMLNIMMVSVMKHTKHTVKFWFIEQFLSPSFKEFVPHLAAEYGFQYEMVTYKWPHWLRGQKEKQREIWGYKILFLDVLFPLSLSKVIFVDADQIVRTDMIELVNMDLKGAPYGFTPMCDSRTEMEGFRFWKQGYWKGFLKGLPYHISALYVVDLNKFREIAAGDRLRQQYHTLSADPNSLSNLDQDLPNHMQMFIPIHSLPQEWLWCETWCSDESLKDAKTIDLCNNPLTKEPKLDRARRQVPEWTVYDDEIAALDRRVKGLEAGGTEAEAPKNTKSRNLEAEITSHKVDEL